MKTSLAVLFIALVSIAAFLMGRGQPGKPEIPASPVATIRTTPTHLGVTAANKLKPKPRVGPEVLTAENAALLTSEERIALLKKAAVLADSEKQADILCGLISAMTEDEILEATKTLLDAQRKGNAWSQEVWNALWTQWGRVNAEACLALSKTGERYPGWNGLNGLNTPDDYRCLMAGWLETHPEAAMAWAKQPKDNLREAVGAAFAIASSANGDLKQMETAILAVSGDPLTTRACFEDYFDLATSTGDKPLPSAVYEQLDPKLKEAAWPETMERLTLGDRQVATEWLENHAGDPGCDYGKVHGLVVAMAFEDPLSTVEWAVRLPVLDPDSGALGTHPAVIAVSQWREIDPAAANAWVMTQPEGLLRPRNPGHHPQESLDEN